MKPIPIAAMATLTTFTLCLVIRADQELTKSFLPIILRAFYPGSMCGAFVETSYYRYGSFIYLDFSWGATQVHVSTRIDQKA